MKRFPTVAILTLAVLCGLSTGTVFAQITATGSIHVKDDVGQALDIEFNARSQGTTGGTGVLTFSGTTAKPDQNEENFGNTTEFVKLTLKVDLDCVKAEGNRAAMSGIIRDSSVDAYRGQRVLLAVEDGGEGSNSTPDKYIWGFYGVQNMNWVPSDSELAFDNGWTYTWFATDAERPDDAAVPTTRNNDVDCRAFSLTAWNYTDIPHGGGNVQVH